MKKVHVKVHLVVSYLWHCGRFIQVSIAIDKFVFYEVVIVNLHFTSSFESCLSRDLT